MELLPLNRLQKRILVVQLTLLFLSLPGLYAHTELDPRDGTEPGVHRPAPLKPYAAALKVEPPTKPEKLPVSQFQLKKLGPDELRRVQLRLRVDVNHADTERLQAIRGVGPVTARKIRRYQRRRGTFKSVRELKKIDGIGPVTLRRMAGQIKLGNRLPESMSPLPEDPPDTPLSKGETIDINTAGSRLLQRLPGVGPVIAGRIVRYRDREGPFRSYSSLKGVNGIGPKTLGDLRPFLRLPGAESTVGAASEGEGVDVR